MHGPFSKILGGPGHPAPRDRRPWSIRLNVWRTLSERVFQSLEAALLKASSPIDRSKIGPCSTPISGL